MKTKNAVVLGTVCGAVSAALTSSPGQTLENVAVGTGAALFISSIAGLTSACSEPYEPPRPGTVHGQINAWLDRRFHI
jgi:hypothetical protein